jgi:hypothetical protein
MSERPDGFLRRALFPTGSMKRSAFIGRNDLVGVPAEEGRRFDSKVGTCFIYLTDKARRYRTP